MVCGCLNAGYRASRLAGGGGMARSQRAVIALLAVLALIGGCAGPGLGKAGGTQARKPVVLTLANFLRDSGGLGGVAGQGARLGAGAMRIDIESRWRQHQVDFETGLIGDVQAGKADLGAAGAEAWASAGINSFQALDAPLLIDSYALQARVVRSSLIGQMLGGLAA